MKRVTLEQIMAWNPCAPYNREKVAEILNGKKDMNITDAVTYNIPLRDKIWCYLHSDVMSDAQMIEWGCICLEKVLPKEHIFHSHIERIRQGKKIEKESEVEEYDKKNKEHRYQKGINALISATSEKNVARYISAVFSACHGCEPREERETCLEWYFQKIVEIATKNKEA